MRKILFPEIDDSLAMLFGIISDSGNLILNSGFKKERKFDYLSKINDFHPPFLTGPQDHREGILTNMF
jgi:hypothetical protein